MRFVYMAIIYCLARQGSQGCATPAKGLEDNLTNSDKIIISRIMISMTKRDSE